jgi:hypothetical protein
MDINTYCIQEAMIRMQRLQHLFGMWTHQRRRWTAQKSAGLPALA